MGDLESMTEEDLQVFFRNNFLDLIEDKRLREYVIGLMVGFVADRTLDVFFDKRPESIRFADYRKQNGREAYDSFREMGDVYLWLCGFYPESLVKREKSRLGLIDYVGIGQTSYYNAVSVGKEVGTDDVGIVSRVSTSFKELARSIYDFRNRVNKAVDFMRLPPETIIEIRGVIYNGKVIPLYSERPMLKLIE